MSEISIVLIGASGGLGKHLFSALGEDYPIIGTYNRAPKTLASVRLDVRDDLAVEQFADEVCTWAENVVLIYAAGLSIDGMAHKLLVDDFAWVLDVNLLGCFRLCRYLLPHMRKQGWGRIINLTSIVGHQGIPGTSAYAASKAGVEAMTRTIAAENAKKGITANCISLGYFDVGMINTIPEPLQDTIRETIPMGRFGMAHELEQAIRFLIGADYVTGTTLHLNGGLM